MSLLDTIFSAGIVGCGGAGFPTHAKLNCKVEYFLINAAECEPLLRTDRYLLINKAKEIISAVVECANFLCAENTYIALKETYDKEIEALKNAISEIQAPVSLYLLPNFYPAGDEQMIVYEVTKRVVPPSGIPLDVGTVVSNTATMLCVYEALNGRNFTHKYLTVTGEVAEPKILYVPVGTSVMNCIKAAGDAVIKDYSVINGGPLMGKLIKDDELNSSVVTKTTSGLIVLPKSSKTVVNKTITEREIKNRAKSACIQCSYCTQLCPRYLTGHPLEPHRIMRKVAATGNLNDILNDETVKQAMICCECGVCEVFACPMGLNPRQINSMLKMEYQKQGMRYKKSDEKISARPEREYRRLYSKKIAARAGVLKYYDYNIENCEELQADRITLKLRQHIGAPSVPIVKLNDNVYAGQLVASCPEGELGANLHTGISGIVTKITDNQIEIEGAKS